MSDACERNGHDFQPISNPYYKVTGERKKLPPFTMKKDYSVKYMMLCCPLCGGTKEIIHKDKRFSLDQVKL